ncbi:MAG: tryptophan synthase subunit alpha [Xanthomonadales bacterium]|nr:tryptophan synthase subunit alpha [Xanthomonadales bacterium]
MNRIDRCFQHLRARGRKALMPFLTAGHPLAEATVPVMHGLVAGGADLIELGVPFSDPMADGPVIQKASELAIGRGVTLATVLDYVRRFRVDDPVTPVVLMGYLNPVEIMGRQRFVEQAAQSGVDGLLLVDAPLEESAPLQALCGEHGLHQILLAAPTTTGERRQRLADQARGFLYYVAYAGVTGGGALDVAEVATQVAHWQALGPTPVAVGFGVKDAASAQAIGRVADAVIVGSALIEHLAGCADADTAAVDARDFLRPLRAALDADIALEDRSGVPEKPAGNDGS